MNSFCKARAYGVAPQQLHIGPLAGARHANLRRRRGAGIFRRPSIVFRAPATSTTSSARRSSLSRVPELLFQFDFARPDAYGAWTPITPTYGYVNTEAFPRAGHRDHGRERYRQEHLLARRLHLPRRGCAALLHQRQRGADGRLRGHLSLRLHPRHAIAFPSALIRRWWARGPSAARRIRASSRPAIRKDS